jgi:hypothetical protein
VRGMSRCVVRAAGAAGNPWLNQRWDSAIVWGLWGGNARALRVVRRIRGVAQFG